MITSEWPVPGRPQAGLFVRQQVNFLQMADVEVEVFHFRGRKNPLNYLRAMIAVRQKLNEQPFDLIHAQFGQSGLLALPKRLPLVVTFHGSDVMGIVDDAKGKYTLHGRLLSRVSRWVASKADAAIVVAGHLVERLPRAKLIRVIPCGIDFNMFRCIPKAEARNKLGLPLNERLVLFAGSPEYAVKRFSLAEKSVELLNRKLSVQLITAWGVPFREMPLYMNACDALILTSMHEGSPGVVKEALSCNLPIVSVDVGDVRERISHVDGCIVCDNDAPETIAEAINSVLTRTGPMEGRDAVSQLDERNLAQEIVEVYRGVLARSSQPTSRHAIN